MRGQSGKSRTMSIRIRKLIGTFALFALVIVWALLAMAIAQFPPIFNNPWIAAIYYVVAGLGWVLPAMPLVAMDADGHRSGHVDAGGSRSTIAVAAPEISTLA